MGPVTYVTSEIDRDKLVVTVLTRLGEEANSTRVAMNYAAGRAAAHAGGVKQRVLMAAAAEEHDVTWVEGPFKRSPLRMFPDAEAVDYNFYLVSNETFGRTPIGETRFAHEWRIPLKAVEHVPER